jgi:hypothetical protein
MPDPIYNYYFCAPLTGAPAAKGPQSKDPCLPFADQDYDIYYNAKSAQADLMQQLYDPKNPKSRYTTGDMAAEAVVIRWLIGREVGYEYLKDDAMQKIFAGYFERFTSRAALRASLAAGTAPFSDAEVSTMLARIGFWRAKIALILVSDIENPASRKMLDLVFNNSRQPVFGVTIKADQTKFSAEEKLALLKELYTKLIEPLRNPRNPLGDPLLEAECLLAQHELRATDPGNPRLVPSQDLKYIKGKLKAVLDTQKRGGGVDIPRYIGGRITDKGWNHILESPYWSGHQMRTRETYRYIAQAERMQAQVRMLETSYNHPDYEKRMNQALALLESSQKRVDKYGDDPVKIRAALAELSGRLGKKLEYPPFKYSKPYGDLLNLLSIDQMRAAVHYKLGLYFQPTHPELSQKHFDSALEATKNITRMLKSLRTGYQNRRDKEIREKPDNTKYWTQNTLLQRNRLLGSNLLLQAGILMVQKEKQKQNLEEALPLLETALASIQSRDLTLHMVVGLDEVNLRLALADAYLRKRSSNQAQEKQKIAQAERTLAPLLKNLNTDPYAKRLEGSIRLAQAKILLASYNLDETDESKARKAIEILDQVIRAARPNKDFQPTPHTYPHDQRPNRGVLEDYELSFALQTRAEAYIALNNFKRAPADFQAALSVYRDRTGKPLNYFALLGQADLLNWSGKYDQAIALYQKVEDDPTLPRSVHRRAELGRAESALRSKALSPGIDTADEAEKLFQLARNILRESDELFMLERALESLVEAVVAKKQGGEKDLVELRDNLLGSNFDIQNTKLTRPQLRELGRASVTLKIADGFLFIHRYAEAKDLLANFTYDYGGLLASKAHTLLRAHHLLTTAEARLRIRQDDEDAEADMHLAASLIFNPAERKKDPYLSSRVIADLIDIFINQDRFEEALIMIFNTLEMPNADKELGKYKGLIKPGRFRQAQANVSMDLQYAGVENIFKQKGLEKKWELFAQDLRLKQAEILVWTQNFAYAKTLLDKLDQELPDDTKMNLEITFGITRNLQRARIKIAYGSIYSQWKRSLNRNQDYKTAFDYFKDSIDLLERKLNDRHPGQELVLARAEAYVNKANVYRYGWDQKDLDLAKEHYLKARDIVGEIRVNLDLKHYHLARIYLGLTKIADEEKKISLEGRTYWPTELLKISRSYADRIVRKRNFAFAQLMAEEDRNDQTLRVRWDKKPNVSSNTYVVKSNQRVEPSLELRTTQEFRWPWHKDHFLGLEHSEGAFVLRTNTDLNLYSRSGYQSFYAGVQFKPFYWMTTEADYQLPKTQLEIGSGDKTVKYLTTPDLMLFANFTLPTDAKFWRGLSTTVALELFFDEMKLNSYYANLCYSAGRDSNIPYLQGISFCGEASHFGFKYESSIPERTRFSPTLSYDIDLKEFDLGNRTWFTNDMARLRLQASLIYEYATNYYLNQGIHVPQNMDNLGFSLGAVLMLNLRYFTLNFYYRYEWMRQDIKAIYPPAAEQSQSYHQGGFMIQKKF